MVLVCVVILTAEVLAVVAVVVAEVQLVAVAAVAEAVASPHKQRGQQ